MEIPGARSGRMRRIAVVAATGTAFGLLAWTFLSSLPWSGDGASTPSSASGIAPGEATALAPAPADAPTALAADDAALGEIEDDDGSRRAAVVPPEAATPVAWPRFRLIGRFVDERGEPIAGVAAALGSPGGPWITDPPADVEVPERLATKSDLDGRFELAGPLPTSPWISFDATPGLYLSTEGREYGWAGGRDRPPLEVGDNDLGELVLTDCGAAEGVVLDGEDAAVAGARVRFEGRTPNGRSSSATSGADGAYRLEHLPAGVWSVEATADGYLLSRRTDVPVRTGETTRVEAFTLSVAPVLSGRVVDESGVPVAGVFVSASPVGAGHGAFDRTDDDGTFGIDLLEAGKFTLGVSRRSPFDLGARDESVVYRAGTTDIEFVLRNNDLLVSVIDPSGTPVERFGLKSIRVRVPGGGEIMSGAHDRPPRVEDHPGGTVVIRAEPQYDDYVVTAPGYGDQRGSFELDSDEAGATIVLAPEGAIVGRFTVGGAPVVRGSVRLARDRIPNDPTKPEDREDVFGETTHTDVDSFSGRQRRTTSGPDGAFRFDRLGAGTYELIVEGGGAAATRSELVRVEAGRTTDVGAIEGESPASVEGRVLLAAGVSPAGLRVSLGDSWSGAEREGVTVLPDGSFELLGIASGSYHVWVHARPGVLVEDHSQPIALAPGERRTMTIDLGSLTPWLARARVTRGGAPADGLTVSAEQWRSEDWERLPIGRTNSEGLAEGWIYADAPTRFQVYGSRGILLAETQTLELAATREPTIEVATGKLAVRIPASPERDPNSTVWLSLSRTTGGQLEWEDTVTLSPRDLDALPDGTLRAEVGEVPPGHYAARLHGEAALTGECEVRADRETELMLAAKE